MDETGAMQAGSRQLRTEAVGLSAALAAAEALAPGDLRRFRLGEELLGTVALDDGFAAIPLDAFDRVGPRLGPCAQAAYFQFLRLSYGAGRDFCRVSKRQMLERLGLSERRLDDTLDELARAGCVRPLHRDNRGTLFRVHSPGELLGEPEPGLRRGVLCDPTTPRSPGERQYLP